MTEYVKVRKSDLEALVFEAVQAGRFVADDAAITSRRLVAALDVQPLNTPTEGRTGMSDREALALSRIGLVESNLRSLLFRITNNRPDPLASMNDNFKLLAEAKRLIRENATGGNSGE